MTDDEKYFFDLNGYLVLREVVDADTLRRCNAAIDRHDDRIEVHQRRFEGESRALSSDIRQRWSEEMVAWERPYCEPFPPIDGAPPPQTLLGRSDGRLSHVQSAAADRNGQGLRRPLPPRRPTRSAALFPYL